MTERIAFALLALFVFTIPWEKSVMIAGIGTAAKLAGALALAGGAAAAVVRRGVRPPPAALVVLAVFVLWAALTWFWSADQPATAARVLTLVQLWIMTWLVWDLCRSRARQRILLAAYVAGACVASAATIARYAANLQTYYRRYAAPGFDPNDLGVTVALAIPMALYLALEVPAVRAAVALCSVAVLLTASRTALVVAALAFGFVPLTWRRSGLAQRVWGILLFVFLLAGALLLAPKASRQRIATITQEITRGTLHKRTTIWKAGIQAWKSRKLTGRGAGAYPAAVEPIIGVPGVPGHEYVAHNTFLSVLVELGSFGFILYAVVLALLVVYALVMRQRELSLYIVLLCVWATGAATLTWEHRKPSWLLAGLIMTEWARSFRPEQEE